MQNKINTALRNRNEILSRFSAAQDLDFGGNIWNTQAPKDPAKKTDDSNAIADAYLAAWNLLWDSFTQAGIRSVDEIKDDEIGWQVCNWAGDAGIALLNAKRWRDCIKLNERILEFEWENDDVTPMDPNSGSMKRSAKRDIAECYAELGKIETSERKFQEFLLADPFWGWGWIGYLQMLEKYAPEKLNQKSDFALLDGVNIGGDTAADANQSCTDQEISLLHAARLFIEANPVAMDADMISQMAEIYQKHGTKEDAAFFIDSYHAARKGNNRNEYSRTASKSGSTTDTVSSASATVRKAPKIGRNDPCPCGSGKKYKKCCGK